MKYLLLITLLITGCGSNILSDEQTEDGFWVGEPVTNIYPPEPIEEPRIQNPVYYLPETWEHIRIVNGSQIIVIYRDRVTVEGEAAVSYSLNEHIQAAERNQDGVFYIPEGIDFLRIDTGDNILVMWANRIAASYSVKVWAFHPASAEKVVGE